MKAAPPRKPDTVQKLRAILSLLEAARANAAGLKPLDAIAKTELLDSISIAELSVLRMLDDENRRR